MMHKKYNIKNLAQCARFFMYALQICHSDARKNLKMLRYAQHDSM